MSELFQLFQEQAKKHPDRVAFFWEKKGKVRNKTYSEILNDSKILANYFLQHKLTGQEILILLPICSELYTLLLALWQCSNTAVFLDAWSNSKRITAALEQCDIQAFFAPAKARLLALKSPALRKIPQFISLAKLKKIICSGSNKPTLMSLDTQHLKNPHALITFTTGSTGKPKGADRTEAFLMAQHRVLKAHLNLNERGIDWVSLPVFALNNLASGNSSVFFPASPLKPGKIDKNAYEKLQAELSIDSAALSPATVEAVLKKDELRLPKRLFIGGAAVYPKLIQEVLNRSEVASVEIVYGSTEAEPIAACEGPTLIKKMQSAKPLSGLFAGSPVPDIHCRVLSSEQIQNRVWESQGLLDMDSRNSTKGEIWVSGEHVLKNYYQVEKSENKVHDKEGVLWHRTGDGGVLIESELWLLGRYARQFTWASKIHWLMPIEYGLSQVEGIATGTILLKNQKPVIVLELRKGFKKEPELWQKVIQQTLTKSFQNTQIYFTKIPRDPRHHSKLDYGKLEKKIGF